MTSLLIVVFPNSHIKFQICIHTHIHIMNQCVDVIYLRKLNCVSKDHLFQYITRYRFQLSLFFPALTVPGRLRHRHWVLITLKTFLFGFGEPHESILFIGRVFRDTLHKGMLAPGLLCLLTPLFATGDVAV